MAVFALLSDFQKKVPPATSRPKWPILYGLSHLKFAGKEIISRKGKHLG